MDKQFKARLLELRKDKSQREGVKLTQKMVANNIGVSDRHYQTLEAGNLPNGKTLFKIGRYFKCNLNWLLYGEGPKYFYGHNTNRKMKSNLIQKIKKEGPFDIKEEARYNKDGDIIGLPTDKLIERLKAACGIVSDEDFIELVDTNIYTFNDIKTTNSLATDSWVFKVSKLTEYSYDYLAFGTGPKLRNDYEKKLHNKLLDEEKILSSIDVRIMDSDLLEKVIIIIEKRLSKIKGELSLESKAQLISELYNDCYDKGKIDLKWMEKFIRLTVKVEKRT